MANPNPPPPPKEYQWKPGQSGNPRGNPNGNLSLVGLLREKLAEAVPGGDGKTYAQALTSKALQIALQKGDVTMIRDLLNRIDGLPKSNVDMTTNGKDMLPAPILSAVAKPEKPPEPDVLEDADKLE